MKQGKRLLFGVGLALVLIALFGLYSALQRRPDPPAPPLAASAAPAASATAAPSRAGATGRRPLRLSSATAERADDAAQGVFEGRVLSWTTSAAVSRAELTFAHAGVTSRVISGEDGSFRFMPPEEGQYELALATANGYLPFAPLFGQSPIAFAARAGERIRGVTIYLTPAVPYVAVVLGPDRTKVVGAEVRRIEEGGGDGLLDPRGERLRTDERGEVRFTAPDDAVFEARHPSYSPARARLDLAAQVSHRLFIRLGPKPVGDAPKGVIAGRVVDSKGAPVEGALVQAIGPDRAPRLERTMLPFPRARSDEQGRFAIEELEEDRYEVAASIPGLAPARAGGVMPGTTDLTLTLTKGGTLRGKVHDGATGKPVPAFSILVFTKLGLLEAESFTEQTVFDAQGAYEIQGLLPGSYGVTVVAAGYAASKEASATIADPPGEPSVADFTLDKGGGIRGVVLEEQTRTPLGGARISLEGRAGAGASGVPLLAAVTTDGEGRFEVTGIEAGLRSIVVAAAGHHGRIVSGLAVPERGELGPVTIELAKAREGEETKVELTGIGAVLSGKGDALVIGDVIAGGGAAEVGLGPADAILAIDGFAVTEIGFEGAIQRIRGPEGSSVLLLIRKAAGEKVEIAVPRRKLRSP